MKRVHFLVGLLIFGVLAVLTETPAQSKIIKSQEYYEGIGKPGVKWYEKSRRVETSDETFANGATTRSVINISEVLLPDHRRQYTKTTEPGKVSEFEQITIDYMQYTRKDGGDWTKTDLRQLGQGTGTGVGISRRCDQYSVEMSSLNGRSMQLFNWLSIDGNGDELMFRDVRKWIGEEGLPYREEELTGKLSPRDETGRRITTYEYDPNIKIEAPIK